MTLILVLLGMFIFLPNYALADFHCTGSGKSEVCNTAVKGDVKDPRETAISGATVSIACGENPTKTTDSNGLYSHNFGGQDAYNNCQITASKQNYASKTQTVTLPSGQATTVSFTGSNALIYDVTPPTSTLTVTKPFDNVNKNYKIRYEATATDANGISKIKIFKGTSSNPITQTSDTHFNAGGKTNVQVENTGDNANLILDGSSTTGNFISSDIDTEQASSFATLSFASTIPSGTSLKFHLRSASTQAGLSSATWYGPSSASDYYTISGKPVNPVHDGHQFVQYKAFFETDDISKTPKLHDITIKRVSWSAATKTCTSVSPCVHEEAYSCSEFFGKSVATDTAGNTKESTRQSFTTVAECNNLLSGRCGSTGINGYCNSNCELETPEEVKQACYCSSIDGTQGSPVPQPQPGLAGWGYRKQITISNPGSALTDYQILVTLDTATLISGGKMRPDGGDIRFTDSDETTQIHYWIESGVNTDSTKIWVKVPSIPAGTNAIYVHYGNPSATPQNNGNNVFMFFDDFVGPSLDATKWNTVGTPTISFPSASVIRIETDATDSQMEYIKTSSFTTNNGVAVRARQADKNSATYPGEFGFGVRSGTTTNKVLKMACGNNKYGLLVGSGTEFSNCNNFQMDNDFHVWDITWLSNEAKIIKDGGQIGVSITTYIPSASLPIAVGAPDYALPAQSGRTTYTDMDWIAVRKLVSTEPTTDIGAEQTTVRIIDPWNPDGWQGDVTQKCVGNADDTLAGPAHLVKQTSRWNSCTAGFKKVQCPGEASGTNCFECDDVIGSVTKGNKCIWKSVGITTYAVGHVGDVNGDGALETCVAGSSAWFDNPYVKEFEFYDNDVFNAKWEAMYLLSDERSMNVKCGLNCDPETESCGTDVAPVAGKTCLPYDHGSKKGNCVVANPAYAMVGNSIDCLFYDPMHTQVNTTMVHTFKAFDFSIRSSERSIASVGEKVDLKVDVANKGLVKDSYRISVSADSINSVDISPVQIVQPSSMSTEIVESDKVTSVSVSVRPLVAEDNRIIVIVTSVGCSGCAPQTLYIPLKVKLYSLPEFGLSGFVQVMVTAGVVYLVVNITKSKS